MRHLRLSAILRRPRLLGCQAIALVLLAGVFRCRAEGVRGVERGLPGGATAMLTSALLFAAIAVLSPLALTYVWQVLEL